MNIELWSDFACPFCYIGEKRLEDAIKNLGLTQDIHINFRSFQLDVNAKPHPNEDINELIAKKYNISYQQAKANNDRIVEAAKASGLDFDFENLIPNNTANAHRLIKYAKTKNLDRALVKQFFKGYFEEGKDLGNDETLSALAIDLGLDRNEVEKVLSSDDFKEDIMTDQEQAMRNGIHSVPFFVLDQKVAVSGAQSVEHFEAALKKVLNISV